MGLSCIIGGQFGSEAKGAVTAAVSADRIRDGEVTVVRVGGPNAGHSAADPTGRVWALRQVPAGMVAHPRVRGVIASGSEVDLTVLDDECQRLEDAGIDIRSRLTISDSATIVTHQHRDREAELIGAIGSTGKGIGAARADRIMRRARTTGDIEALEPFTRPAATLERELNAAVRSTNHTVVIEGTQGFGLGVHTKYYPQTTSGDCRAIDVCAQAGINPWGAVGTFRILLVIRPYPIRVAGNSGPLKGETTWEKLGQEPELTTVTRKIRRVGTYDSDLVNDAIDASMPYVRLAVSMLDKVPGAVKEGIITDIGTSYLGDLIANHGVPIEWVGTGPLLTDWVRWEV